MNPIYTIVNGKPTENEMARLIFTRWSTADLSNGLPLDIAKCSIDEFIDTYRPDDYADSKHPESDDYGITYHRKVKALVHKVIKKARAEQQAKEEAIEKAEKAKKEAQKAAEEAAKASTKESKESSNRPRRVISHDGENTATTTQQSAVNHPHTKA